MSDTHEVKGGKNIVFGDDVERRIRPLSIKQLRKFVDIIDKLGDTSAASSLGDDDIDTMVDAAQIILEKVDPHISSNRDMIEDIVDLNVFNEMMNVAMGNTSPEG